MPLWGRKLYQPRANERNKNLKSPKFRIPFTEEVFDSEKEYKEQLALYQQPLWTCQSSGDSGLTYEEAHASELQYKNVVGENISIPLQKTILQMVHHSTGSLEFLVDRIEEQFNTQFHVGEVVELAKCKGKIVKGKIVQVKSEPNQTCNGSPSSDKENHSIEPELLRKSKSNKNKPLYYNIQIGGKTGKVISSVPASDLIRCEDVPAPEFISLLIRSNALQAGTKSNSTWVVTPDVVKALDIRNKLIETMLPSTRISIRGLKGAAKRKPTVTSPNAQAIKKPKVENGCNADLADGEKTPPKRDSNPVVIVDTDSEEYQDASSVSPSPEKVLLDHSYSSPQAKTKGSASPTPEEASSISSPQPEKPPTVVTKQGVLRALGSVKEEGFKVTQKRSKKTKVETLEKEGGTKSKSVRKQVNIEQTVEIVSDSSESSDSSDSDIILMDLSKKLSPPRGPKPPAPVRRTLADHFLSMSKGKDSQTTSKRTAADRTVTKATPSPRKTKVAVTKKRANVGGTKVAKVDASKLKQKSIVGAKKGNAKVVRKKPSTQTDRLVKASPAKVSKTEGKSVPLKKSPAKLSPKKGLTTPKNSPSKKSVSLATLARSLKSSPKKKLSDGARGKTNSPAKSRTPVKSQKGKGKSPTKVSKTSPKKTPVVKKTPLKQRKLSLKASKSKSLKQVTLFNFSSKKKTQPEYNSSDDDALILYKIAKPTPPFTPREPPIAAKMMRAKRANDKSLYNRLVGQAARMLTKKQILTLKPLIQGDVMARAQVFEARMKWQKMTPEEKKKILEAKRGERKKKREAEKKKKLEEEKEKAKRYEDQVLDLKPLIVPKPVPLPEGLPNTLFGDIAMVVEFLNCYSGFLMPNDPYPVTTDSFMKALVCDKEGFAYLSRMMVILLKTLLQDQITEDFVELGMKLSDIPVNMHTASELLRLSLLQADTDTVESKDYESDTSSINQEEGEFTADLVELLETSEFFSLSPEEKLELMVCVCNRILSTYSLVDYMEDKQRKAAKLWCQKMQTLKLKNDQKREEKKRLREVREAAQKQRKEEEEKKKAEKETNGSKPEVKKPAKKKAKKEETKKDTPPVVEEPEDLASIVKRRRILAAKAKQEQEEQAKRDLERRLKEQEEMRIQKEKLTFEKNFEEGIQLAKSVLRQLPIGTDRNHNRYWVFSTVTPGLFIEKGWAVQDIDYKPATSQTDENGLQDENAKAGENDLIEDGVEKSYPKEGQNLWFQYDTVKELDTLMEGLNNAGIRESALYGELTKRYSDISKLIFQSRRSGPQLRDSDGPKELLESFKEDMKDIETHVRQGNLGGVANFEKWEKRLNAATSIKELGSLVLESQESVNPKFLEGMMAPPKTKSGEDHEEEDEETEEKEDRKLSDKLYKWQDSVKSAVTMSRLHVLLSIFEVCVKWEKSSENAKCKICRKKGDTSQILLCDECNQPFHLLCLRPALTSVPSGEWKCPSCAPLAQRPGRKRNYKDMVETDEESEEEEEDEEESENEDSDDYGSEEGDGSGCCVCGMGDETITCTQCDSAYHKDCHEPPMRNFPRGKWTCHSCLHGRSKRKGKNAKSKKRGQSRR
ncbi:tyrosine-protein kinase BAZ1B-like isoform X2 [Apostichopus japonicus]|uniref:tyrosine-protein kinase BAZ1B-like isoform X2 n=1 Tax=Stichopus japonicus TaxID=307972 RepID=UPI003AB58153